MDVRSVPASPPLALALVLAAGAAILALSAGVDVRARGRPGEGLEPLRPDLNTAPARQLVLLPGIGPTRAAAIVEERSRAPFGCASDLTRVRGIGPLTAAAVGRFVRAREGVP
jgi:competence protein ComEA